MARPWPGLQQNAGRWDEHVGTPRQKNGQQNHTCLPTRIKRRSRVVLSGPATNHRRCVDNAWGDSWIENSIWQHVVLPKWWRKEEGRYRRWQEKAAAQEVTVLMLFLWIHRFSFGCTFVFFLRVYICVFHLKSTSASFLWVYGIRMFFPVCVYGYREEGRCASHTRPERSCSGKIHFPEPPQH